ncbi:serine/threonine-protein kinase [Micromonospora sp. DR5-3]|uniref:WD40 repeat domain-containing serine/threonine protein kinase n=1 Tax=unclassified Micromonospora TaxID=2617518 RepID=UPI001652A804|nr:MULTISPECIES: serine/threonine-protein kinase [unclassified Micromonospora]MCW3815103.1 serine/threonine-protein kinase [Micromonospora sp. DR5-3]
MQESRASEHLVAGRYRLTEVLGRGGMGVVWRATDELIGRAVAVKEVRPPAGLPPAERALFGERALREARTAGRINHPGVVAIHDLVPAEADDEAVYIVSELVQAPTLADVLHREGPLPPTRVSAMAVRILEALTAAHANGVVHRDIKPSNIMVLDGDGVKLVDFGIAQAADDTRLTRDGVMGSTGYLAPELFHGGQPTPETDLWAVGVTLWQAVNGVGPFERDSTAATIHAVLYADLPAVRCDPPLATVIAGLLVREPADRMSLQQARDLLAGAILADAPPDPTRVATPGEQPGSPEPGAAWEQDPTNLHAATGTGPVPRQRAAAARSPEEGFAVVLPASVRHRNRLVGVVTFALFGTAGWLLLHATLGAPLFTTVMIPLLLAWVVVTSTIRPSFRGRFEVTESGLVFKGAVRKPGQPPVDTVLRWKHIDEVVIAPSGATAERSRVIVRPNSTAPATVISAAPFKGFLRRGVDGRVVYTLGDVDAGPDDVAEAIHAAVPDGVTLTGPTGGDTPRDSRLVGPRRDGSVFWILAVLALIAGTLYYRHQNADLVTLAEEETAVVAYNPAGTALASGADRTITVWNPATRQKTALLSGHSDDVTALAFSPDGKLLISGDDNGVIKLWNITAARATATVAMDDSELKLGIERLAISPDGATLAAINDIGDVGMWRLNNLGKRLLDDANVEVIRFSTDSRVLLGVDSQAARHAWQTTSGREVRPNGVFGPMATVQNDHSVLIRDAGTDQILATLRGDGDSIYAAAFGPGDLFATGTWERIQVWHIRTGRTAQVLETNLFRWSVPRCDSLAMRSDGRAVACASDDGLRVWTFAPEH